MRSKRNYPVVPVNFCPTGLQFADHLTNTERHVNFGIEVGENKNRMRGTIHSLRRLKSDSKQMQVEFEIAETDIDLATAKTLPFPLETGSRVWINGWRVDSIDTKPEISAAYDEYYTTDDSSAHQR